MPITGRVDSQPAVSLMGRRLPLDGKRKRHVDASQAQESLAVARLDAAFSIRYAIMRHRTMPLIQAAAASTADAVIIAHIVDAWDIM